MKQLLLTILLCFFSGAAAAQKYRFQPGGTMQGSQWYVNKIISAGLPVKDTILFFRLDSSFVDSFHCRQFFKEKYDSVLREKGAVYLLLVNLTRKPVVFEGLSDSTLIAEDFAQSGSGFRPVSYAIRWTSKCGTGLDALRQIKRTVSAGGMLLIRQKSREITPSPAISVNCFVRLKSATNGVLVSGMYKGKIDKGSFYINPEELTLYDIHLLKEQDISDLMYFNGKD